MFYLVVNNICMNIPQADTELMDHVVGNDQIFTAPQLDEDRAAGGSEWCWTSKFDLWVGSDLAALENNPKCWSERNRELKMKRPQYKWVFRQAWLIPLIRLIFTEFLQKTPLRNKKPPLFFFFKRDPRSYFLTTISDPPPPSVNQHKEEKVIKSLCWPYM